MKINVGLSIGYPGATRKDIIEVDDEELEGLPEKEQDRIIDERVTEWAEQHIETGWNRAD